MAFLFMLQVGQKEKRALKQLRALDKKSLKMRLAAQAWDSTWKTLIATMMSAQSRDETTIQIAEDLFEKYPNLESLARAKYSGALAILRSLNYNKTKSRHIIACAKVLVQQHAGKVPHDFEKLIELPGVGRKTANVFLSEIGYAAIGIDTHAAYISQKLGWTKNRNPHKIEEDLKKLFPKKYWRGINQILVRFGKTYTSKKEKDKMLTVIKSIK